MAIDYNTDDEWVLGEPFFRSFVSIFDDQKGIVAMATSVNHPDCDIYDGPKPVIKIKHRADDMAEANRENMKKLPNFNDPIAVIKFVFSSLFTRITTGIGSIGKMNFQKNRVV